MAPASEAPAQTAPASPAPSSSAAATPAQIAQIVETEFPTYDGDKSGDLIAAEFGAWMKKLRTAQDPAVDPESADVKSWIDQAYGAADADKGLARLIEWAKGRERPTVIAFFGDHLPPLGPVYVETGFLANNVAPRKEPPDQMLKHRNTPLVLWSSRSGPAEPLGAISPALLPYHVLKAAGITHPYYTGFLGALSERYRIVDRNVLFSADGEATPDWARQKEIDPAIRDFRFLQYDMMFGKRRAGPDFFPETVNKLVAHTS